MVQQDKKGRRGKKIDRNSGSFRLVPNNEYEQDEVSGISCQDKCPSVQGGSRIVSQSSDRQGHLRDETKDCSKRRLLRILVRSFVVWWYTFCVRGAKACSKMSF